MVVLSLMPGGSLRASSAKKRAEVTTGEAAGAGTPCANVRNKAAAANASMSGSIGRGGQSKRAAVPRNRCRARYAAMRLARARVFGYRPARYERDRSLPTTERHPQTVTGGLAAPGRQGRSWVGRG